jgi:hypothetical protein
MFSIDSKPLGHRTKPLPFEVIDSSMNILPTLPDVQYSNKSR